MDSDWDLAIGDLLSREERATRFGGAKYGGIEPSRTTLNVFVYSDPSKGEVYGYTFDGWADDWQVFLYTGEGQAGDQVMTDGNRALLEHRERGRSVRLFVADGEVAGTRRKNQRYLGEFEVDPAQPYSVEDAVDEDRIVFVFRLLPVGTVLRRETDQSDYGDVEAEGTASLVGVEENVVPTFPVAPKKGTTAERREAELVDRYMAWAAGQSFRRWKLKPPGELRPLLTDIYSETENILFEAKGTAARPSIRSAIGQLFDYRRHIDRDGLRLAVLLPHRPSEDLVDLVTGLGIYVVAELAKGGFEQIGPGGAG
jgi:hypothetical protein